MIAIVDYGLGNIRAFGNIFKRLDVPFCYASEVSQLKHATRIILPGVGSFDYAMLRLNESGLREALDKLVLVDQVPVLGICVGMQIMANSSEEGRGNGLGWLDTKVVRFPEQNSFPLPHMGWNNLSIKAEHPLLNDLDKDPEFYFLHSYHFKSDYEGVVATAKYIDDIGCVVSQGNVSGIQCHPEKSHHNGVTVLKNFASNGLNA